MRNNNNDTHATVHKLKCVLCCKEAARSNDPGQLLPPSQLLPPTQLLPPNRKWAACKRG